SERKMAGIYCSVHPVRNEIPDGASSAENKISNETNSAENEILGEDINTVLPEKTSEEIGPCFYIDETGTAYEEAPQSSGSLIIFVKDYENGIAEIGKQAVRPEILTAISRIDDLFRENLNIEISEIKLNSRGKNSIEIAVKNGWSAIFNSEDAEMAFLAMRTILEKEIKEKQNKLEYIDLRFGTKVYYKFKNSE
ncbi:MAG: cell division protein FtsQ/DivIB, partial [Patescibacteria group bacterium]